MVKSILRNILSMTGVEIEDVGAPTAPTSAARLADIPAFNPGAPTSIDIGDSGSAGTSADVARSDHEHPFDAPSVVEPVAGSGSLGTSSKVARENHAHEGVHTVNGATGDVFVSTFPGYGALTPTSIDIGDAGTPGVSPLAARSDHEHPAPPPLVAPPAVGNAGAIGTATTPALSDHTHLHPGDQLVWGNNSVAASVDTRYLTYGRENSTATLTAGVNQWVATRNGTAHNLYVRHNSAVGNGNSVVYALLKNGAPTALTVTLATGAVGQVGDTVNSVAFVQGDRLELRAVKALALGNGAVDVQASIEYR